MIKRRDPRTEPWGKKVLDRGSSGVSMGDRDVMLAFRQVGSEPG